MSGSLQPHGLHSPWNSPGQNKSELNLTCTSKNIQVISFLQGGEVQHLLRSEVVKGRELRKEGLRVPDRS